MRLMNSKTAFFFLLGGSVWAQNPEVKINGASQARFGFTTSINIQIVRNDIKGPARLIAHLPDGWTLLNPVAETALYSQTGNDAKAVWLEFPLKDTVYCSMQFNIPESYRGTANIQATLEYFKNGNKQRVNGIPFPIEVRKFYSRL
jgi:hypothetical protein